MKDIAREDVETYVRRLIDERFGPPAEDMASKDVHPDGDGGADAASESVGDGAASIRKILKKDTRQRAG